MRYYACALFVLSLMIGCGNNNEIKPPVYDNSKIEFYPVKQFLDSQIADVMSTPYYIYQISVKQNKRDSVPLTQQQFKLIAEEFTQENIADHGTKQYYKETAFHDASMQTITLNYTTTNPALPVRSIDVLLEEDGKTVKRIFITKQKLSGDSSTDIKFGWKTNKSFFINRSIAVDKKPAIVEQVSVVWNEKEGNK